MLETELQKLITQVDHLLALARKTKIENLSLHKKLQKIHQENIALLNKNSTAITILKKLMQRLDDELHKPT